MDMFKRETDFVLCTFLEYESDPCVNILIMDRKKERYSNSPDTDAVDVALLPCGPLSVRFLFFFLSSGVHL
jgi:hypothetical protein